MEAKPDNEKRELTHEFLDLRRNSDPPPDWPDDLGGAPDDKADEPLEGREDLSKSMRKRLARQATKFQREIDGARQQGAKAIEALEAKVRELESANGVGAHAEVDALESKIEAAMEAGNSKEVARLSRQLAEAIAEQKAAKRDSVADPLKTDDRPRVLPRTQQWLDEQDWWDDPEHSEVQDFARKVDAKLVRAGYDPRTDAYYEELERVLDGKFPGVVTITGGKVDDDDDDEIEIRKPASRQKDAGKRSPVKPGVDAMSVRHGKPEGGTTLAQSDIANMRKFGFDPASAKDVEAYVKYRR